MVSRKQRVKTFSGHSNALAKPYSTARILVVQGRSESGPNYLRHEVAAGRRAGRGLPHFKWRIPDGVLELVLTLDF